ncbi:MAG: hypothetical protein Q7J01_07810 [Syntrophales bacterium]|nr:hypothetical protein [Syntrophales bacterium]
MVSPEPDIPAICFDEGPSSRARLGFVILATDETSEADLFRMAPPGIGKASSLLPPESGVDAVSLHCAAGSLILGGLGMLFSK